MSPLLDRVSVAVSRSTYGGFTWDDRGAGWLLALSGKARPRGTVFVPEYIDLAEIDEVNLIDPLSEDDSVNALDPLPWCQVQVADLDR